MTQPNIVVIQADQLAPQFTGTYGHPLVQTPNMDALAKDGMRFDAAYCNSPLCAPSRFSMMSGQQVSQIAGYDNAAEFKASIPTFAHYLRQMGYSTCLSGKMHFVGPDQLHGFEERLTTDIYPADLAWIPDWEQPDERIDHWYHNMDAVRQAGPAMTTFQYEYDDEVTFLARRRIFEYAMQGSDPFAMVVSLIHPHDPYVARPEFWNLYDPNEIDMPQTGVADDPHTQRVLKGIEANQADLTDDDIRKARHGYYANTSYFDDNVGKIVQALKEADLYNNTIIIVTADHGDMLGERGLWYKMNFFEHSARVPLIMHGPGVASGTQAAPVSLVDLLPTLVDIAASDGSDRPEFGMPVSGNSLWPMAQGKIENGRSVFGEYCAEMTPHPILMIRRGAYKYIHCDVDPPQLFNLDHDPMERNNLADDPEHAELSAAFAREAAEYWDADQVHADVLATQKQRRAVHAALTTGKLTSWDYAPPRDASNEFVRNHVSWDDVLHRMQYPAPENSRSD